VNAPFERDATPSPDPPASPRAASGEPERGLFTPRFVRILIAQSAFSFGWSLYLIAPKYFATALAADARTQGHLSAVGGLLSIAMIPVAARGIDRVGPRTFFITGCGMLGLLSIGFMLVHDLGPGLYILNGLVGASFVLAFNAGATLATDDVAPQRLAQAIGVFGASNMIMNGVSTIVAEKVAAAAGWNGVFAIGLCAALCATAVSATARDTRRHVAGGGEHTQGQAGVVDASLPQPANPGLGALAPVLACAALVGGAFSAMFVFFQPYALARGAAEVNDFFVGFTLVAVIIRTFFGHLGDRFGRVRVSAYACIVYALAAASMIPLQPHWLLAHGALFGLGHGVLYPTLNAVLMERVGLHRRGRAMTLYTGAFNVGTTACGLAWGLLADGAGYPAVYAGAAILSLLALLCLLCSAARPANV
jgi:MFS family permease